MRLSRVYAELPLQTGIELTLPPAASAHLLRVLRLRPGAALTLFNGRGGEFEATLLDGRSDGARVRVGAHQDIERESPLAITLLQGISRGDRMDTVVQKATELGVARIVPVNCEFSVVRLDAAQAAKRVAHWQAVAIGACEQCGRNRVPRIDPIVDTATAAAAVEAAAVKLLLAPEADRRLVEVVQETPIAVLLIGPEGGLSEREEAVAARHGFVGCRLGPRILRTETAPLAALAVLQAVAGDLGMKFAMPA
jgi:16S rRNA (uracil1498-N3)-methyltransferase